MKLGLRKVLCIGAALLVQALLAEGRGKDYYSTLGLKKNAKDGDIKRAYRYSAVKIS